MKVRLGIVGLVVMLLSLFGVTGVGFASNNLNLNKMESTKAEGIYFDKETAQYYDANEGGFIGEVYEVKDGEVVNEIPVEEYIKLIEEEAEFDKLNQSVSSQFFTSDLLDVELLANRDHYSRYTESSNEERRVYGSRSSIVQENHGPGSDTFTIGYSASRSRGFSISVTTTEIQGIQAGVTYKWENSASISSSHKMTIPAGYAGYWRFDPKIRSSTGVVRTYLGGLLIGSKNVTATYPVKLNGKLDGYLVSVKYEL